MDLIKILNKPTKNAFSNCNLLNDRNLNFYYSTVVYNSFVNNHNKNSILLYFKYNIDNRFIRSLLNDPKRKIQQFIQDCLDIPNKDTKVMLRMVIKNHSICLKNFNFKYTPCDDHDFDLCEEVDHMNIIAEAHTLDLQKDKWYFYTLIEDIVDRDVLTALAIFAFNNIDIFDNLVENHNLDFVKIAYKVKNMKINDMKNVYEQIDCNEILCGEQFPFFFDYSYTFRQQYKDIKLDNTYFENIKILIKEFDADIYFNYNGLSFRDLIDIDIKTYDVEEKDLTLLNDFLSVIGKNDYIKNNS